MKKIYTLFAMLLVAVCVLSCEKEISFNGEESASRLTVSALAQAGEPLSAYVSSSVFFLKSRGFESFIKALDVSQGSVRLTINGAAAPIRMRLASDQPDGSLLYNCDYVPQPGDHLVLEAEFPGFDPVRAETDVPYPPHFEVSSLAFREEDGGETLDLTLRFRDDGSYEKYYFLIPRMEIRYGEEEPFQMTYRYASDDVVFKNMGVGAFDLYGMLFGDNDVVSYYFSDELIRGKEHTMKIEIPGIRHLEEGQRFFVEMRTVTESLYWFDVSYAQLESDFALFSEGVTLYSNVQNGYGVFCATAGTCVEVHF
ncbi:MAG: DUF4249 domain-containing protein [Bacteroidales bacterium]|nr:DUF4249 domain-containing protein [Bacteroidales bacterium]